MTFESYKTLTPTGRTVTYNFTHRGDMVAMELREFTDERGRRWWAGYENGSDEPVEPADIGSLESCLVAEDYRHALPAVLHDPGKLDERVFVIGSNS
jgi:hypothetical protein